LRVHAAALDHEARDDAMKDQPIVVSIARVIEKVFRRDGRVFRVKLDPNIAHARRHQYHGIFFRHRDLL